MNDLPIIQLHPTPTDAELEAERDAKHAVAVQEWVRADQQRAYLDGYNTAVEMARTVIAGLMADALAEEADDNQTRSSIGLGRRLSLLAAGERINWQAQGEMSKYVRC